MRHRLPKPLKRGLFPTPWLPPRAPHRPHHAHRLVPAGPYQVGKLLPNETFADRRNLKVKFLDLGNATRHSLKSFGIRLSKVGRAAFEQAVRAAVADDPLSAELMDAMLTARCAVETVLPTARCRREYRRNEEWRRFMAIPGVGPVTALSFMTAIDDPSRFRRSRDVAAYFGLTSRRWQSGSTIDVQGRISKAGDADVRRALYEAASGLMTRFKGADKVKSWGQAIAKRSCHRKASVAVVRKLAVIMHALWSDGTFYVGDPAASQADAGRRAHDKARKLLGAHR